MLRVLDRMGSDYLRKTSELKYLLSPILVKNVEQQALFYELFDRYLADMQLPLHQPKPVLRNLEKIIKEIPRWVWGLLAILFVGVIGFLLYNIFNPPEPSVKFSCESTVVFGDSIHFINQSNYLPPDQKLLWEIRDATTGDVDTSFQTTVLDSFDLSVSESILKVSPKKIVRLSVVNAREQDSLFYESALLIICSDPPLVEENKWPENVPKGKQTSFSVNNNNSYTYEWFIDNEKIKTPLQESNTLVHTFNESGVFNIKVNVSLPPKKGDCQTTFEKTIVVGKDQEIAPLQSKKLYKDDTTISQAFLKPGWWAFLGLLLLLPLWWWYRWWRFKPPHVEKNQAEEFRQRFAAPDQGPYFIPFQPKTQAIHAGKELYEFANTLRLRQEGLRTELDVTQSLKATIDKGGFPEIRLARTTQPSEYLFLIDEQYRDSIQSRLFEYLVHFLQDKDIYADRYFYNNEPYSLWKNNREDALTLQQVQRMYPHYRLVVLGDAHSWLNQSGDDPQKLKSEYTKALSSWKKRILLSPIPAKSWTYKEAGLNKWFSVFPADVRGIKAAFEQLQEAHDDDEHLPLFSPWQQAQIENRELEPDINYRKWRRTAEIKDYLQNHPALWKWCTALAVHPVISWPLTLAIGQGLESEGVEVTFDNLLILSRIPWLQEGQFSPKLRLQLLDELDPAVEKIARQCVKEELEAIEELTKNSFSNIEQQTGLAIQNFLLDPENVEHQETIRNLIQGEDPIMGKQQFEELNQQLNKNQIAQNKKAVDLKTFLNRTAPVEKEMEDPVRNPYLKMALLLSLLWLGSILTSYMVNGGAWLHEWSFGSKNNTEENPTPFAMLVNRVDQPADLATIKNNEAVDIYTRLGRQDNLNSVAIKRNGSLGLPAGYSSVQAKDSIVLLLKESIALKNGKYPLAENNLAKNEFNQGNYFYEQYFEKSDSSFLEQAREKFEEVSQSDSIWLDAKHAMGLVKWYLQDTTWREIYDTIVLSDSSYFDSLNAKGFTPNLQTFMLDETPMEWVQYKNTMLDHAVKAGVDEKGNEVYICRALHQRGIHPGKLVGNICTISWGGKTYDKKVFEVLTKTKGKPNWKSLVNNKVPNHAIPAGYNNADPNNQNDQLYIGRTVNLDGTVYIGKVLLVSNQYIFNYPLNRKERIEKSDFEILTGISYPDLSNNKLFGSFTDKRDNQNYSYKTMNDGKQWMLQNLNYEVPNSSCYDNKEENCKKYGRLYPWETAQNVCPSGWHLPSEQEWRTLANAYGGINEVAYKNLINDPEDGLSITFSGARNGDGGFSKIGVSTAFWTSTETNATDAWFYDFHESKKLYRNAFPKSKLMSLPCRCVKDEVEKNPITPSPDDQIRLK